MLSCQWRRGEDFGDLRELHEVYLQAAMQSAQAFFSRQALNNRDSLSFSSHWNCSLCPPGHLHKANSSLTSSVSMAMYAHKYFQICSVSAVATLASSAPCQRIQVEAAASASKSFAPTESRYFSAASGRRRLCKR